MNNNFLEYFTEEKQRIKNILQSLKDKNLISDMDYRDILKDIEDRVIKIAIIGQMKYGKSTFINSFIFHSPYLPTSSIPMTAALSEIKYGDKEYFKVLFFTKEEFKEMKNNPDFEDIIIKADKIPNIDKLFGKEEIVSKHDIQNYVGSDGLYTPIVKMFTIYNPKEILKETIIVDTPGFNDPIVAREEIAKRFIKEADFVLLFLYADRPFDRNDRDIIIDKLQNLGKAGKIIFVLNKADMLLDRYGSMDRVKVHIKKVIDDTIDDYIVSEQLQKILKEAEIVPISSLMALLARMNEKDIKADENLSFYYNKYKNSFPNLSQDKLLKLSNIQELEELIATYIQEDKLKIILDATKSKILSILLEKKGKINIENLQVNLAKKLRSQDEVKKAQEELKYFEKSEYRDIVETPLVYTKNILIEFIDNKVSNLKYKFIYEEKDDFYISISRLTGSKKDIVEKYKNRVKQFNSELRGNIKDFLNGFESKYKDLSRETMDKIFSKLRESEYSLYFELNQNVLNDLRSELDNFSKVSLGEFMKKIEIRVPAVDTGFFFGDKEDEIKDKLYKEAKEYLKEMEYDIIETYQRQLTEITINMFDRRDGKIRKRFDEIIIQSIKKTIEDRTLELKHLNSDIQKDKSEFNKNRNRLQELEDAIEYVNREI